MRQVVVFFGAGATSPAFYTQILQESHQDVSIMESAMLLDDDQASALGNMEVGKAVVKLQGRIPDPFMIQVPKMNILKGLVTDEMIKLTARLKTLKRPVTICD